MNNVKKITSILLLLALMISGLSLVSCGKKYTAEETRAIAQPLLENSLLVNDLYFGNGLPAETSEIRLQRYLDSTKQTIEKATYLPVAQSAKYSSQKEIKTLTEDTYAASYAEHLYRAAFFGIAPGDEDEVTLGLVPVVYARYLTVKSVFIDGDEVLCVKANAADESFNLADVSFDYSSIQFVRSGVTKKVQWLTFSVDAHLSLDGKETLVEKVEFRLVNEENGWRLDSPTYFSKDYLSEGSE